MPISLSLISPFSRSTIEMENDDNSHFAIPSDFIRTACQRLSLLSADFDRLYKDLSSTPESATLDEFNQLSLEFRSHQTPHPPLPAPKPRDLTKLALGSSSCFDSTFDQAIQIDWIARHNGLNRLLLLASSSSSTDTQIQKSFYLHLLICLRSISDLEIQTDLQLTSPSQRSLYKTLWNNFDQVSIWFGQTPKPRLISFKPKIELKSTDAIICRKSSIPPESPPKFVLKSKTVSENLVVLTPTELRTSYQKSICLTKTNNSKLKPHERAILKTALVVAAVERDPFVFYQKLSEGGVQTNNFNAELVWTEIRNCLEQKDKDNFYRVLTGAENAFRRFLKDDEKSLSRVSGDLGSMWSDFFRDNKKSTKPKLLANLPNILSLTTSYLVEIKSLKSERIDQVQIKTENRPVVEDSTLELLTLRVFYDFLQKKFPGSLSILAKVDPAYRRRIGARAIREKVHPAQLIKFPQLPLTTLVDVEVHEDQPSVENGKPKLFSRRGLYPHIPFRSHSSTIIWLTDSRQKVYKSTKGGSIIDLVVSVDKCLWTNRLSLNLVRVQEPVFVKRTTIPTDEIPPSKLIKLSIEQLIQRDSDNQSSSNNNQLKAD